MKINRSYNARFSIDSYFKKTTSDFSSAYLFGKDIYKKNQSKKVGLMIHSGQSTITRGKNKGDILDVIPQKFPVFTMYTHV
jgi:hypothetical protein